MNMKWIIIGAVLVILLVAFGRNPVEEGRRERARQMQGKDPLVHAIEEHNKEEGGRFSGRSMGGFGRGNVPEGAERVVPQNYPNPQDFRAPVPAASPQTPPANQGYYPPPPGSNTTAPQAPGGPRSQDIYALPGGESYAFFGTKTYKVDAAGNRTELADGRYPIAGGRLHLVIKNGEKVGISY